MDNLCRTDKSPQALIQISQSRNHTPTRRRSIKTVPKALHSGFGIEVEEGHLFLKNKNSNSNIFPSVQIISPSDLLFTSSLFKQKALDHKKNDGNEVLMTEILEPVRPYGKSLNVSWADTGGHTYSTDKKKSFSLANSLNSSIIEQQKSQRNTLERPIGPRLTINIENIIIEQNESQPATPRYNHSIRQALNQSIIQCNKCELIDFYEALTQYNQIDIMSLRHKPLFKSSFFSALCFFCVKKEELNDSSQDICEKYIRFVYSAIRLDNTFHKNLLISACVKIFKVEEIPEDPEVILKDLMFKIKCGNDILLGGFFNILFLDCFFPEVLERFEEMSKADGIEVLDVIYKLSRVNLRMLRKKKMNSLMVNNQKCLEILFFSFAGICLFYIEIRWESNNIQKRAGKLEKLIENRVNDLIQAAKKTYFSQLTEI